MPVRMPVRMAIAIPFHVYRFTVGRCTIGALILLEDTRCHIVWKYVVDMIKDGMSVRAPVAK
jgi:hypothetical protein